MTDNYGEINVEHLLDELWAWKRMWKKEREDKKNLKDSLEWWRNEEAKRREEIEKLKEKLEWYKTEHERLVDKLVIKGATELLDRKFENKKGWQGE